VVGELPLIRYGVCLYIKSSPRLGELKLSPPRLQFGAQVCVMTDTSVAEFDSRLQHATAHDTGFHDDGSLTVQGGGGVTALTIGVTYRSLQGARGDHA